MAQVKEKKEGIEEKVARIEGSQYELSKRIDDLKDNMNQRFHELRADMNKRFGVVDRRFDDMNQRFNDIEKRFSLFTWTITSWLGLLTILIVLFKFI